MLVDKDIFHTWDQRRRNGRVAPDTLAVDYGYLQPPVDVFAIARRLGVELRMTTERAAFQGDGCLIVRKGQPYIVIKHDQSRVRQRFTVAHELGHLLLHEVLEMRCDEKLDDATLYWRDMRSGPFTKDRKEVEANQFAAKLLMPAFMMQTQEPGLSVSQLARRFEVSRAAMNLRLHELYGLEPQWKNA